MTGHEMGSAQQGYALVELHNRAHLSAVYGDEFGVSAMRVLQWRVTQAGGAVALIVDDNRFLARLPLPRPLGEAPGRTAVPLDEAWVASPAERWHAQLTRTPLGFGTRQALPVLTVTTVGKTALGANESSDLWALQALETHDPAITPLAPVRHTENWRRRYAEQMGIAVAFHHALTQNQASLVFQPIVQGTNHDHVLYQEALLRLAGDSRLTAMRVVPILEQVGVVGTLDHVVITTVINRLQEAPTLHLGCNLSALSLAPHGWWDGPLARLAAQPELAARLTLEITETAPLADGLGAVAFTRRLRALGCQIALDDFGAGYTSLAFALAVKPQVIKIDAALVRAATDSGNAAGRLVGLAAFCRSLAPEIVAEGIENDADIRAAAAAGIDWLQGRRVAPPMSTHPRASLCAPAHALMECPYD
ncbi:hypothetical protein R75465_08268 [Paraburkholderia aspalathi]|uniref:EAL domain-containing protein n=1 Tax=Paraburkholderia aspalathi TaxID=1324617 RepID=UPI001B15F73A|nr:EAL domain-containing protein [Paraburkholderia aspalathi]CAE6870903.1 hypothetical protein R75465_08268 [Paraburkholderia aspalathi]